MMPYCTNIEEFIGCASKLECHNLIGIWPLASLVKRNRASRQIGPLNFFSSKIGAFFARNKQPLK